MYEQQTSFWQPSFDEERRRETRCTCRYIGGKRYIDPQKRCPIHRGK